VVFSRICSHSLPGLFSLVTKIPESGNLASSPQKKNRNSSSSAYLCTAPLYTASHSARPSLSARLTASLSPRPSLATRLHGISLCTAPLHTALSLHDLSLCPPHGISLHGPSSHGPLSLHGLSRCTPSRPSRNLAYLLYMPSLTIVAPPSKRATPRYYTPQIYKLFLQKSVSRSFFNYFSLSEWVFRHFLPLLA
jgi:hypothetical protein